MSNEVLINFDQWYRQQLLPFLKANLPHSDASEVYHYALIPWGKLFRPQLCASLFYDLMADGTASKQDINNLAHACLFLELHHTYSLAHDDLPCMDDDDVRRGRPSLHKQFNEWKALLCGDGLLNLSYLSLSKIESKNLSLLFKLATKSMGPCGLIHGQYLDLNQESTINFKFLLLTHELKTARLIQLSLIIPLFLNQSQQKLKIYKKFWRAGYSLGLVFQLIDDLTELSDPMKSHEKEINPWPLHYQKLCPEIIKHLNILEKLKSYNNLYHLISLYKKKMGQSLLENHSLIIQKYPQLQNSLNQILREFS